MSEKNAIAEAMRIGGKRRWWLLAPVVPVLALLAAVYLPWVNSPTLWFGLPALIVWCSVWVLLLTPALAVVEYLLIRPFEGKEQ